MVKSLALNFISFENLHLGKKKRIEKISQINKVEKNKNSIENYNKSTKISRKLLENEHFYEENKIKGKIITTDLHSEMSRSYMAYAMSVIYGRALPDVRDGFKPVHRRILFAMDELGLYPDMPFRKCARVVGEVLGKYHPHGDNAVYDALVRMAQDFSMRSVLIFGHGNFGSIDHDPPAAMRYTECKISHLSKDLILKDINKQITNFVTNFDGSCSEPSVLPTRLPNLLLNGSNGIAVGMATNVPPHNLTEIVRALVILVDNPDLKEDNLLKLIPGPDFPTGGSIIGLQGCSKLYKTGQASIILRAKTHFENSQIQAKTQKVAIVITEIPYQVNKASLLFKIAEMVNQKIIEGIADLRDESDRDGIRVVIELKKDSKKEVILNTLFKKTPLQNTFGAHFLALVGHQPSTLSLRELLLLFIEFRKQTIRRAIQYELGNAIDKSHIINGLILTIKSIDFVLSVIQKSFNNLEAKIKLIESGLTQIQGESILNIQLRRLTKLESNKVKKEDGQLEISIRSLKENLAIPYKLKVITKNELSEIAKIYGMPRRTNIIFSKTSGSIEEIEMIDNFSTIIMVTKFYIKRMVIENFESQTRGTRGKKGLIIQEDDTISHFFSCNNHDTILCVSQTGLAFAFKAYKIPISRRINRGVSISDILPNIELNGITSIISIPVFTNNQFLVLLTKNGIIKKTPLIAFKNISARGLLVLKVNKDDQLGWVKMCCEVDDIFISTKKGKVLRFPADHFHLRATGRNSIGKNSMKVEFDDNIVDMDIFSYLTNTEIYILAITSLGYGKRIPCEDFKKQSRGGKGLLGIKLRKENDDKLVSMSCCKSDQEVLLSTQKGTIVRQKIEAIAIQSRFGMGVIVQKLISEDFVSKVLILSKNLTRIRY
nr:DNA gyrase subunit A [Cryptomonas curvata]